MKNSINSTEKELLVCKNCNAHLNTLVESGHFTQQEIIALTNPARVIGVNFPIVMDDGNKKLISGFRIQYNDALGPTKGGIRMHEESDIEEVAELAFLMSLKTSLVNLPYGGAKGAIKINPKELSDSEREKVVRGYGKAIAPFIGPNTDIPAPDVNTGPVEMAWLLNEYEKFVERKAPAVVTGKAIEDGGSLGRDTSTSLGGFFVLTEYLKKQKKEPKEISIAIQGFGNVGGHLAELLYEAGFKVVAVSDSKTGIYNKDGLPIPDLIAYKKERGAFIDRKEEKISNEKLLELPVDVLIPAALGGVITSENVADVQATLIMEMANAPITAAADDTLTKNEVVIIPDILANAGGVIVSYFEWLQNKKKQEWALEDVNNKLEGQITDAHNEVMECSQNKKVSMRDASYIVAIERIIRS